MKFGKRLRTQIEETIPEWRNKFLSYKELKKRLKTLPCPENLNEGRPDDEQRSAYNAAVLESSFAALSDMGRNEAVGMSTDEELPATGVMLSETGYNTVFSPEEVEFRNMVNQELEKFNDFFIDKEEDYIIKIQDLKDRMKHVNKEEFTRPICSQKIMNLKKELVAVHGEMVLLENYSILNYMGLIKILKKHDKRTGALLKWEFINTIYSQPFYRNDVIAKLVKECEALLQTAFPPTEEEKLRAATTAKPASSSTAEQSSHPTQEVDEPAVDRQEPVQVPPIDVDFSTVPSDTVIPGHIFRSTLAALRTLQEMRGGTPSAPSSGAQNTSGNCVSTVTKGPGVDSDSEEETKEN